MPAGPIEIALKDVVESRLASLREEIAYCELVGQPVLDLVEQVTLIERLRKSHSGRPRVRIV